MPVREAMAVAGSMMAESDIVYVYVVSPECRERQCLWRSWTDDDDRPFHRFYQHGENPEAVLIVDLISAHNDPAASVRQQFRAFAERCHRYEDGDQG